MYGHTHAHGTHIHARTHADSEEGVSGFGYRKSEQGVPNFRKRVPSIRINRRAEDQNNEGMTNRPKRSLRGRLRLCSLVCLFVCRATALFAILASLILVGVIIVLCTTGARARARARVCVCVCSPGCAGAPHDAYQPPPPVRSLCSLLRL